MFWKRKKEGNKNQKIDPDFIEFKKDISWFVKESDKVSFGEKAINGKLSELFQQTFPKLTELISKARILPLTINGKEYKLYSWTSNKTRSCGWLIETESTRNNELKLCWEHELLLEEIGGIREFYNQPEPSLCNNQNFMFIGAECNEGIGEYNDYYEMRCEENRCEKLSDKDLISFVQEANGGLTLYNSETKKVYLFSHDHSFDNVKFLENQPEYTYHTFKWIETFIEYVESLSMEWLKEIEKKEAGRVK